MGLQRTPTTNSQPTSSSAATGTSALVTTAASSIPASSHSDAALRPSSAAQPTPSHSRVGGVAPGSDSGSEVIVDPRPLDNPRSSPGVQSISEASSDETLIDIDSAPPTLPTPKATRGKRVRVGPDFISNRHTRSVAARDGKQYQKDRRLFLTPPTTSIQLPSAAQALATTAVTPRHSRPLPHVSTPFVHFNPATPTAVSVSEAAVFTPATVIKRTPPVPPTITVPTLTGVATITVAAVSAPTRAPTMATSPTRSPGQQGTSASPARPPSPQQPVQSDSPTPHSNPAVELPHVRHKIKDFLAHVSTQYPQGMAPEEAHFLLECHASLTMMARLHCYDRARQLSRSVGPEEAAPYYNAYEELCHQLDEAQAKIESLSEPPKRSSRRASANSATDLGCSPFSDAQHNSSRRKRHKKTAKRNRISYSNLANPAAAVSSARRAILQSQEPAPQDSVQSNSHTIPDTTPVVTKRNTHSGRSSVPYTRSLATLLQTTAPRRHSRTSTRSKVADMFAPNGSSSPGSSSSSSSSSSSWRPSSPSSSDPGTSDSESDSDSDLDSSSDFSPRRRTHSKRRTKKSKKKTKKVPKRSPTFRYRTHRKKKHKTNKNSPSHPFAELLGLHINKKSGYVPSYAQPGGEGRRFYKSLPSPWNVLPLPAPVSFTHISMLQKSGLLTEFDGSIAAYKNFRDQFVLNVHRLDVSVMAKASLLRNLVCKVAELKTLLDSIPSGEKGYKLLIQRLEEKYGGNTRLLTLYLRQISQVPVVQPGDLKAAEALLDAAQGYRAALLHTGQDDASNHVYYALIKNKLAHSLRMKYTDYCVIRRKKNHQSVSFLLRWLQKCVILPLRQDPAPIPKKALPPQNPAKPHPLNYRAPDMTPEAANRLKQLEKSGGNRLFTTQSNTKASAASCPRCDDAHPLAGCPSFLALEAAERRDFCFAKQICFRCLNSGHRNKECVLPLCHMCQGDHHHLIHGASSDFSSAFKAIKAKTKRPPRKPAKSKPRTHTTTTPPAPSLESEDPLQEAFKQAQQSLPPDDFASADFTKHFGLVSRCLTSGSSEPQVSLRFVPVLVTNPKTNKMAYVAALLDDGSNLTAITDELALYLGADGPSYPFSVVGLNGHVVQHNTKLLQVQFSDMQKSFTKNLVVRTLPDPAGGMDMICWDQYQGLWPHLRDIKLPPVPSNLKVQMIIGNDQPLFHRSIREIPGPNLDDPVARLTALGHTITGRTMPPPCPPSPPKVLTTQAGAAAVDKAFNHLPQSSTKQRSLTQGLTCTPQGKLALWRLLDQGQFQLPKAATLEQDHQFLIGSKSRPPVVNPGDRKALLTLSAKSKRLLTTHFQAPIIWSSLDRPQRNAYAALADWLKQEARLSRNPEHRRAYEAVIQGWIDKGYVRRLPNSAYLDEKAYYLPHFPVLRADKSTTKIRVVMNGKASFAGKSLNDFVLRGPKLLNSLVTVLLRFRRFRIAICGDVREMFLQVKLAPEDLPYFRFFYTFLSELEPCILENLVHVFGCRGSPVTVVFIVKAVAMLFLTTFILAALTLLDSTLVDDFLDSVRDAWEASELVKGLKEILKYCHMTIHKWVCSDPAAVPELHGELVPEMEIHDPEIDSDFPKGKALGIFYDSVRDQFRFRQPPPPELDCWTRMSALQYYMSLFDPIGLILPILVAARLLFRDTWQASSDWETTLIAGLQRRWNYWVKSLELLPHLRFPRWIALEHVTKQEHGLHLFCDASKDAYGVVAYLVSTRGVKLVMAKAKLCKRQNITIPIAELEAARLAVNLAVTLCMVLDIPPEATFFWGDNTPVLNWIKAPPRVLPYFVARVAAYIRASTRVQNWRHVPTDQNPADLVSRGCSTKSLAISSLWFQGPDFLHTGDWPPIKVHPAANVDLPSEEALRRMVGIFSARTAPMATNPGTSAKTNASTKPLTRISTFHRAITVLRHCCRFVLALYSRVAKSSATLDDPLVFWILLDQWHHFRKELLTLQAGLPLHAPIFNGYDIQLEHNIIFVGGRTHHNPLPLLHKDSHLARLWLNRIHGVNLRHAGGPLTLKAESRKHFWVFKGTALFRSVTRSCFHCNRANPKPAMQRMAPLPAFRLDSDSKLAFKHISIDFAGPYKVSLKCETVKHPVLAKRYVLVICCCVFRAVSLVPTNGNETDDVALALQDFASRHRIPYHIHSDNAAEFIRVKEELRILATRTPAALPLGPDWANITWTLGHPRAPHTNGIVESIVGISKRALAHCLANAPLTDQVFRTALSFAEQVVNLRPLAVLPDSPADPEPLTPGHFTGQQYSVQPLPVSNRLSSSGFVECWKYAEKLQKKFAARFFTELVPELTKRGKWWDILPEIVPDQVVVVLNCPPNALGLWPLGRVLQVKKGKDDIIRGALVLVQGKEYYRHIRHLVPLA